MNDSLKPCPDSPNCVSTFSKKEGSAIAPITTKGTRDQVMAKVRKVLSEMPRTKIVSEKPNYLHVEFTSALFRFVDDVEFLLDEANTLHFRSASRIGHSDLGANRKRMEEFRIRFFQA
ncbi:MAG: DUF1499 domain-containing protein [Bdellovibrionales bacterium]|nr:DUF1499 domain-containing protein [Bdellovibrionales bacterium]